MARDYFKQVVLGLMYLYERGMYHRDIKPETVFLIEFEVVLEEIM
jgi:serine/threonine protein kinase